VDGFVAFLPKLLDLVYDPVVGRLSDATASRECVALLQVAQAFIATGKQNSPIPEAAQAMLSSDAARTTID